MARTKGSITNCGHCYQEGHNRRTCPDIKKEIERNPEGYYARQKKRDAASRRPRTCSYCEESGHNRATCKTMKQDKTAYQHMNWKYQNAVSATLRKAGLSVGSIICRERYFEKKSYYLITGIKIDMINLANWYSRGLGNDGESSEGCIQAKRIDIGNMSEYDRSRQYNIDVNMLLPRFSHEAIFGPNEYDSSSQVYTVVGPVSVPKKYGFNREAGLGFMTHEDMKNGRAHRTLNHMKEKIKNSEIG